MIEYPKIESLFNRDKAFKFRVGDFRCPEFEYLRDCPWIATEKVDGTNIRIGWDGERVTIGGRTDRAQIPTFLLAKLNELLPAEAFTKADLPPLTLFGEGYGAKIQKGGGNYIPDGCSFALFDVLIDQWWLRWSDVFDVSCKLHIDVVPAAPAGKLIDIWGYVAKGFYSHWGSFPAEGVVARPIVDLCTRSGDRIITKIKTKDFER